MTNSKSKSGIRIDFRTFFILMLFAAVPLVIGSWWLFSGFEDQSLQMAGADLSGIAETAFSAVNSYLQNRIIDIAGLTEVTDLREAINQGNQDLKGNLEEVRKAIPKMDAAWPTLDKETPQAKAILENQASRFLRRYTNANSSFRQIVVTDFFGRLVAATDRSTNYYLALKDWWKETYGDGTRGSVYIGDVYYDPQAKSYFMDLAQPFVEPGGGVTGIIKVVLSLQRVHSLVGSFQAGPGTSVILIHAKGDVISAPGYTSFEQRTYPATLDILTAREKGRISLISKTDPPAIYGLSQRSFQQNYPHLNWILAATRQVSDVLDPQRQLRRYFITLQVGIFIAVLIAILMLSRVETKPVIEEDPHLEKL